MWVSRSHLTFIYAKVPLRVQGEGELNLRPALSQYLRDLPRFESLQTRLIQQKHHVSKNEKKYVM